MEDQTSCPVCDSTGPFALSEETKEDVILRCNNCSLEFAKSMRNNPYYYEQLYYNATPGLEELEKLSYEAYLNTGKKLLHDTSWQPYNSGLKWILEHLKENDTVLDIGCGAGWILATLEAGGFNAVGVEVSERVVNVLRGKGFNVFRGPLETCPEEICKPQAVTMFEVLEHLQDPVKVLKEINKRFPEVPLIISVPTPKSWTVNLGIRSYCDYPPNHLTRWTEKSLRLALACAGYKSQDFIYSRIPAKEIYAGIIIWLMFRMGLRRKGYFGEINSTNEAGSNKKILNALVRLLYPVLNLANKLLEALFLPFGKIAAVLLNMRRFTSFCVIVIAQNK